MANMDSVLLTLLLEDLSICFECDRKLPNSLIYIVDGCKLIGCVWGKKSDTHIRYDKGTRPGICVRYYWGFLKSVEPQVDSRLIREIISYAGNVETDIEVLDSFVELAYGCG